MAARDFKDQTTGAASVFGSRLGDSFTITAVLPGIASTIYRLRRRGWQDEVLLTVVPLPSGATDRLKETFLRDLDRWTGLGMHPHLATCYGLLPGDPPAYFLEDLRGSRLTDWLKSGDYSLRAALSVAIQFCHGLEYLHDRGMVHGNISPQTLFVTTGSLAKITDIVLPARRLGILPVEPPETGEGGADIRTDIFAFGCCLWQLFCTNSPAGRPDPEKSRPRFRFKDVPVPLFTSLFKGCLAGDPERRFQNAAGLRQALNHAYERIFGVACPYFHLKYDLRAESCNNQAVFLLETGRHKEGILRLRQALFHRDRLAEANHNLLVQRMTDHSFTPRQLLLLIEAAKHDSSLISWLSLYEKQISRLKEQGKKVRLTREPLYLLCPPCQSLSIYRQAGREDRKKRIIRKLVDNLRYEAALSSLLQFWRTGNFEKDPFLTRMYDRLCHISDRKEIVGVQRYATLKGLGETVRQLAHIPTTRKIIEAGGRDFLLVRDYGRSHRLIKVATDHDIITCLTVSPDGRTIAAGCESGGIFCWNGRNFRQIVRSSAHRGRVRALAMSDDNRFLASGGDDGMISILTLSTGREKTVTAWQDQGIRAISFVPGGLELVTASDGGQIKTWSARAKKCLHTLNGHAGPIDSLVVAASGEFFLTAAGDIKIWDRNEGDCLGQFPGHSDDGMETFVLLLDGDRYLVSGGGDGILIIRDLRREDAGMVLDSRSRGISCLAKGSRSHFFFAGLKNGSILVWKLIHDLTFN